MKKIYLPLLGFALLATGCGKKVAPETGALTAGIKIENLDTTANLHESFYDYACGGWMQNNPLTAEYSRFGSFDQLAEANRSRLKTLITSLADQTFEKGTVEQKVADLYKLAMDSTRRNNEGIAPLKPILETIDAAKRADFAGLIGEMTRDGILSGMFYSYVSSDAMNSNANLFQTYQGGLGLGQRDYYLADADQDTKAILADYQKFVAQLFTMVGYENAEAKAKEVLAIETSIANAAYSNVELRNPQANYNKMSMEELQAMTPAFDWNAYLAGLKVDASKVTEVSVGQVPHMKEVNRLFTELSDDQLRTYLEWQAINSVAGDLNDEMATANFEFFGKRLSGRQAQSPRWKKAVSTVNGVLGEAVGQMYVKEYFPPQAKARMVDLVKNLQISLGERIEAQAWMSAETKQKAHEKLDAFHVKIGYPDKWRDYTELSINAEDSYLANLVNASRFESDYQYDLLGKPVDKDKWGMTPQTVNAYYNPTTNEICFPAGILQYPFFDMKADDAFNYGAIGVVIGHEMTHGFDDQGAQFDKDGNMKNWWTEEDQKAFKQRTEVMAAFFDNIEVAEGVHANGHFTLGENIADHGGLQISYNAFKHTQLGQEGDEKLGLTADQRFFLAYSGVWANNIRPAEVLVRTKSDPHSLGKWRVNGALPQINAWYEAFNISKEDPMYVAPENRVDIW